MMHKTGSLIQIFFVFFLFVAAKTIANEVNCTTFGEVRLYNGSVPSEGSVQVCSSDQNWSGVCDYSWDCIDATVTCKQLGYSGSDPLVFIDSYFGQWETIEFGYFTCSSLASEDKLVDCTNHDFACNSENLAGLRCVNYVSECTHGEVRLTGAAEASSVDEGKVEMCYDGIWTPVCSSHINDEEAAVVCKQLGHEEYSWASIYTEGYGNTPLVKQYLKPACSSTFSESKLSDCTLTLVEGCSMLCEVGRIKCFDPGECDEGDIRLADGKIEQEGRIEVCINGVWGTVCGTGFHATDGYIACKQLGKGNATVGPVLYFSSDFDDGQYPIAIYNPVCGGWEKTLTDCTHSSYGSFYCPRTSVAAVLCYDDCEDGEVRLTGTNTTYEGTVEVCLNSLWGMIGESRWSLQDGRVVCGQLGLSTENVRVFNNSYYGKSKRPVNINNVACTGMESQLLECNYFEFSLSDKKSLRSLIDVVGVMCGGADSSSDTETASEGTTSCINPQWTALLSGVFATLILLITVSVTLIPIQILMNNRCILSRMRRQVNNNLKLNQNGAYAVTSIHR